MPQKPSNQAMKLTGASRRQLIARAFGGPKEPSRLAIEQNMSPPSTSMFGNIDAEILQMTTQDTQNSGGIFVALFDDASFANNIYGRTSDELDRQSSMLLGSINATLALGKHAVTTDAALVMNGLLAELWAGGQSGRHLEAAVRNGWLRAASRGSSIFDTFDIWTKDWTRNPTPQRQRAYVNWLRDTKSLDAITLPMGATGPYFEDRFWAHTVGTLLVQCSQGAIPSAEVGAYLTEVLTIRDEASRPLSRVMLRLNQNSEQKVRLKYPNVAPRVLVDTDANYNDGFAAVLNLPSLVAQDGVPTMPLLRHGISAIDPNTHSPAFAFPDEQRLAALGRYSPEQVVIASKSAGIEDVQLHIDSILKGAGSLGDHAHVTAYIARLATQLATVREDAAPMLPAVVCPQWRIFSPELADQALTAVTTSKSKEIIEAASSVLAVVGTVLTGGVGTVLTTARIGLDIVKKLRKINSEIVNSASKDRQGLDAKLCEQAFWETDVKECREALISVTEALRNEVRPIFRVGDAE